MAKPLASHPSLVKIMAEAMLEDEYKLSHSNLQEWAEEEAIKAAQTSQASESNNNMTPATEERDDNTARDDNKKTERSVVIQVPPKRQKLCTAYSPKEVVEGKLWID